MNVKKVLINKYWGIRSFIPAVKKNNVSNIYHATIQKTGSQWIKTIFKDPRIKKVTGLEVYPQHRYEAGEFIRKFPKNTFVPGLYISPILYNEIEKPDNYRTFYIVRDPRDIVVSWYYSMKETHKLLGNVGMHRTILQELSFDEGLTYCIRYLSLKFCYMRNWYYESQKEEKIKIFKFEDLTGDPLNSWDKIFKHCKINIEKEYLDKILKDYTKNKMRKLDLAIRKDQKSHYRKESSKWDNAFKNEHIELFQNINGDLTKILGYED